MTSAAKWLTLACLIASPCLSNAADAAALVKRLHNASDASSLDDPALKPWHLKLDVQLYDAKGNLSEKGTIEEWWTPDADKRVYDTPSYSATEIRRDGHYYKTKGQTAVPFLLGKVRDGVVHPLAADREIAASRPELRIQPFGSLKLDCIMLAPASTHIESPRLGLFDAYCLDKPTELLRVAISAGDQTTTLNRLGKFQGRNVALDQELRNGEAKAITAQVTTLVSGGFDVSTLKADNETNLQIGPDLGPVLTTGVEPIYPSVIRARHISGSAHMVAIVGVNGRIVSVKVTGSPDPSLAEAALTAVRQSIYKPATINGLPTEADLTISMSFNTASH